MDFIYVTILLMYFFSDFTSKGQNDEQGSDKYITEWIGLSLPWEHVNILICAC